MAHPSAGTRSVRTLALALAFLAPAAGLLRAGTSPDPTGPAASPLSAGPSVRAASSGPTTPRGSTTQPGSAASEPTSGGAGSAAAGPLVEALEGGAEPLYSIGAEATARGYTARWRPQELAVELSKGGSLRARLVLGVPEAVLGRDVLALPGAPRLAAGTPALDAEGLALLFAALARSGAPMPPTSPEPLAGIPAVPTPARVAARPLTGARIRTLVIDPGHGGKDPGAHGPDGLREKNVCLDIALRLRRVLRREDPALRVVLTRDADYFVSLEERTRIANRARGDLFLSIHNNASPNPRNHGTQVFFFDSQSSNRAAADLTLRENGEANQLDVLMTDLAKSVVRDQSIGFAGVVQRALGRAIGLKRRRLSYAPFYVLARTEMPAILVEVAFITNPREERLLGSSAFRQSVAEGLARGVERYSALEAGLR